MVLHFDRSEKDISKKTNKPGSGAKTTRLVTQMRCQGPIGLHCDDSSPGLVERYCLKLFELITDIGGESC